MVRVGNTNTRKPSAKSWWAAIVAAAWLSNALGKTMTHVKLVARIADSNSATETSDAELTTCSSILFAHKPHFT